MSHPETRVLTTTVMLRTAQDAALSIPYILDIIFSECDRWDNVQFSYVCWTWMNIASKYVWDDDPPLEALFGLLAPLVPNSADKSDGEDEFALGTLLEFSESIDPRNWERFAFYAAKVKHLSLVWPEFDSSGEFPNESVFLDVAAGCNGAVLFPHIKSLYVVNLPPKIMKFCTLFFHKTLTEVEFFFDTPGDTERKLGLEPVLQELPHRCQNLRELSLRFDWHEESGGPASLSLNFLRHLQYLQRIALLSAVITEDSLKLLSALPDLQRIDLFSRQFRRGYVAVINSGCFSMPEEAFPSLRSLLITCDIPAFDSLLFQGVFSRLVSLYFDLPLYTEQADLHHCFQALSRSCPRLRQMGVSCMVWHHENTHLSANTLYPLKSLSRLERLYIDLPQVAAITDEESVDFVAECSSLRSLCLNVTHLTEVKPTLTLGCLKLLAERNDCRRIESLGIYIDATQGIESLPDPSPLENLRYVTFGTSPVKPANDLISYLARALPSLCQMIILPAEPRPIFMYIGGARTAIFRQIEAKMAPWKNIYHFIQQRWISEGTQGVQTPPGSS